MALITCPECGRQISDKADACVGCGCPIRKNETAEEIAKRIMDNIEKKYNPPLKFENIRFLSDRIF
jgi:uncharacterized membrane protein YvbJ